jgi:hypothetical protein
MLTQVKCVVTLLGNPKHFQVSSLSSESGVVQEGMQSQCKTKNTNMFASKDQIPMPNVSCV